MVTSDLKVIERERNLHAVYISPESNKKVFIWSCFYRCFRSFVSTDNGECDNEISWKLVLFYHPKRSVYNRNEIKSWKYDFESFYNRLTMCIRDLDMINFTMFVLHNEPRIVSIAIVRALTRAMHNTNITAWGYT